MGSQFLTGAALKGTPVLGVWIVAPMEFCLAISRERFSLNGPRALEHIQRMDNDRKK